MLDPRLRALCKGENYGVLATNFPDGHPQAQVMWIDCDDEHVIVNTETNRAKFKNIEADPRVAVTIWETGDPTSYFEVRGQVVDTIIGDEAKTHLDTLAQRYFKVDTYPYPVISQRAVLRIRPDRVVSFP